MKLRIHGNSIRFRVTQSEVARLSSGEALENWLLFTPSGTERLGYAIEVSSRCNEVLASFSDGVIRVTIPVNLASTWANANQVGIEHIREAADGSILKIAIEKDFRCLQSRPGENAADNYPNPGKRGQS